MFDPEEFDSALDDLEIRLERLHLQFERFFAGSEGSEPSGFRDEIDQQFAALLMNQRHLGALSRVRLTILHQRYDGYRQCWERLASRARSSAQPYAISSVPPPRSRSSIPAPRTASLTPPLGTRASAPPERAPRPEPSAPPSRQTLDGTDSTRTIRDFLSSSASGSAQKSPARQPPFEPPPAEQAAEKKQPRPPLPVSMDSSSTTPYLRLPDDAEFGLQMRADAATPSPPQVSMERVRDIHARLRASNTRPPSLERLAKRLSETEAKLKAVHGDRTVTFDVVLKNGKAIVKPIVH